MRENWDFYRGDIYIADLNRGAIGYDGNHVQGGTRPVVLLQNNISNFYAPTLVVVPITSKVGKKPTLPTHCYIPRRAGLNTDGIALAEQITTIDKRQCVKYLGRLDRETVERIKAAALSAIGEDIDIPDEMEAP